MNRNFLRQMAAFALFFCFIAAAQSQTVAVLPASKVEDITTSGNAGALRNHLLVTLNGKLEKTTLAENIVITGIDRKISADVIAQLVTLKSEKVELVCIRVSQGDRLSEFNLVQYANGTLSELQGNDLVAYSSTREVKGCVGGGTSNCNTCTGAASGAITRNASIALKASGFLRSAKPNCLGCFGDIDDVLECITGHR
jgi:hypothetical protein